MTEVLKVTKPGHSTRAIDQGLEPGYAEDKWGPWKSHKLLLNDAVANDPSWSSRAGVLAKTFAAFSRTRSGFLTEKEFNEILTSFVCCEEIFFRHFFQLFDRDQDGFLSEVDFISGMLAVSPITEHDLSSAGGQLRLQLIFLYYDANRNGRLDVEELSLMIEHLEQLRAEQSDRGPKLEMREIAVSDAKSLMGLYRGGFWYRCLHDACVKGMLSGMDQLLRTSGDLSTAILKINPQLAGEIPPLFKTAVPAPSFAQPAQEYRAPAPVPQRAAAAAPVVVPTVPTSPVKAPSMTSVPALPPAVWTQSIEQRVIEKVVQQVGAAASPYSMSSYPPPQAPLSAAAYQAAVLSGTNHSIGSHLTLSPSNAHSSNGSLPLPLRVVRSLMDFSSSAYADWRSLKMASATEVLQICDSVAPLFRREDSLVPVSFPTRIYGDIHGNLPDLVQFFNRYSWPDKRKGDILSMNYVFLGDFVDRGSFSLEVVVLLFSLKLLYPSKVWLIRGNHEDRNMNYHYGFRKSCHLAFGPVEGQLVWEKINDCFDLLPLAALVGEQVLCVHGGIGSHIESVSDLIGIDKPIVVPPETVNPEELGKVDKVVLDALWSDPFDASSNAAANGGSTTHLSPRGNGANRYSAERVKSFCANNNLLLIVRAHQCVQNGYEYFADGLLLTVFSATSYCNQYNNDGGMVVLLKGEDGSMEEHAQVIKTNNDSRVGWEDAQFRQPSPMRGVYMGSSAQQLPMQARMRMPFMPVTYPASPSSSRLF